jgi:hypothetical protein
VEVAAAAAAAHVRVNEDMHAANFDDTLSGTTAISVLLKVRSVTLLATSSSL